MKNENNNLKKTAWIFLCIIALLLIGSIACILWMDNTSGSSYTAYIYQDGELIQTIDLRAVTESYQFTVTTKNGRSNTLEVRPGEIGVSDASCPDHICVNQGFIHNSLLPITCLPNKLVIQLEENTSAPKPDAITY